MTVTLKATAAPAVGDDPLLYVMSDESVDRYGDVIEARGWDLSHFRNNPVALFGHDAKFIVGHWRDVRVEGRKLLGRLELMDAVSDRLREIHAAVKAGVLRAVSVGFHAKGAEPIKSADGKPTGGLRFTKSELVECSLVAVPANPNALQVARSLSLSDETKSLIFAKPGEGTPVSRDHGKPAVLTRTLITPSKGLAMQPLSQRVQDAQERLVALKDQLTEVTSKSDIGETEEAIIVEVTQRIEAQERSLDALKRAETALAVKSGTSHNGVASPAIASRRPLGVPVKEVKPADHIVRAATVAFLKHTTHRSVEDILRERYPDDELTPMVLRAAVAPATTTTSGWASELVNTAIADFMDTLTPVSIYPRLAALGNRFTFDRNGAIRIPSRSPTPSIGGSFVGEGSPIPVRRFGLGSVTLTPTKMGVISTFTREMGQYSTPAIEGLIRQAIVEDTAVTLDSALIDTTAGSTTRPAGLLNGVTGNTATAGGGYDALIGDIRNLYADLTTSVGLRNVVFLMNPAQTLAIALTQNVGGDREFAAEINAGRLLGRPVIESATVAAGTVIAIDVADFVTATGDAPEFDVSDQAVVHMEDTSPAAIGTAGVLAGGATRSLWQTATVGVRMLLDVNWAMRRTGGVAYVTSTTW